MKQLINLSKLDSASFFNKETLGRVIEIGDNSLYANIKRWLKRGELVQLKKGLYVTKGYVRAVSDRQNYTEFVANILKQPSYLSGEYILQKYGMLTESVFGVTSVTLKKTGKYQNVFGTYIYSTIKEKLFTGFNITSKGGYDIKEATKAKALFDFLYFRLWRLPEITKEYLESLRLNLGEMQTSDFAEFDLYLKLANMKKLNNLTVVLKELTYV
jgi:predicted transcriptional regulator of viral defense system